MTYLTGYDTVDVQQLYGLTFNFLMGYVGGSWPTYHPMCIDYPPLYASGHIVPIATSPTQKARLADCEKGDFTVANTGPWLGEMIKDGVHLPGAYANLSTWESGLKEDLAHYGDTIFRVVADWTGEFGVLAGYDMQQWTMGYRGHNVDGDASTTRPFGTSTRHTNLPDYGIFTGVYGTKQWGKLDEEVTVKHYDLIRADPAKYPKELLKAEAELKWLADRVAYEAIYADPKKDGDPSWGKYHRGMRYQDLIHRARDVRFV